MTITEMAQKAYANSFAHGFYDGPPMNVAEKLALIHSEVSEALEEVREAQADSNHTLVEVLSRPHHAQGGKPVGFLSELADVLIRVGDLAGALGASEMLEQVTLEKMKFNESRPYKHGKGF